MATATWWLGATLLLACYSTLTASEATNRHGICDARSYIEADEEDASVYWQCTPNAEFEGVSEWQRRQCARGDKFVVRLQRCQNASSTVRRMSLCHSTRAAACQPQSCGVGQQQPGQAATIGAECDWLSNRFQRDQYSSEFFLQCVPVNTGSTCGVWARTACMTGTRFNLPIQACLPSNLQNGGMCGANKAAVCACNGQQQCPANYVCMGGTCCAPQPGMPQPQVIAPQPQPGPQVIQPQPQPQGPLIFVPQPQPQPGPQIIQPQPQPSGPQIIPRPPQPQPGPQIIQPQPQPGPQIIQPRPLPQPGLGPLIFVPQPQPQPGPQVVVPQPQPGPQIIQPQPSPQIFQMSRCPNGEPGTSACNAAGVCPPNQFCYQNKCCPLSRCPNGDVPVRTCEGGIQTQCPANTQCINSGCCPLPLPMCPNGPRAMRACRPGMTGECDFNATGQYCYVDPLSKYAGCCMVPACPDGSRASSPCQPGSASTCAAGAVCVAGACCALPRCPNGAPAVQTCSGQQPSECPTGFLCVDGSCCSMRCLNGKLPLRTCSSQVQCPTGTRCENGMCCEQVVCPNGQPTLQQCQGQGLSTCPTGYGCYNGGCCRIALCPNGMPSVQSCLGIGQANCPMGYACVNEMCCRVQGCPSGELALQPCSSATACPMGFECVAGSCCRSNRPGLPGGIPGIPGVPGRPLPNGITCPAGSPAGPLCTPTNPCAPGYVCTGGICCLAPLPRCPSGQTATQLCLVNTNVYLNQLTSQPMDCNAGMTCINGACCPPAVPLQPTPTQQLQLPGGSVCSAGSQPVCYCAAYNYACPPTTSCTQGMCCAPNTSPLYNTVRPGDRCSSNAQCPGVYSNCVNGYCICSGNSRSNGVQCVPYTQQQAKLKQYSPGSNCGQFAVSCSKFDYHVGMPGGSDPLINRVALQDKRSIRRLASNSRLAMSELGIDEQEEPVFWYTAVRPRHFCRTDADCTPDMTCIEAQCLPYLSVGESGCVSSLQCSRTTLGSACQHDHALGIASCACQHDWYWHHRQCVRQCPSDMVAQQMTCVSNDVRKRPNASKASALTDFTKRIAQLFSSPARNER